ncbi:uncharacterized protein LOC129587082 [Paramacrobiotus metropolitanus]|uniref:uncharacterized protein LOC129587082 n=1 Tax=Paramacrobiotus metropolitanus TaxID=2943436 RepID=UPI002445D7EE|nr:uncharacterized protein LOC129587082 [Paramacrobiotus metropolitanus]XP_055336645.1 uncharacterized protein LOC129587082 [Paramacrobiotus metropolitanus]
MEKATLLKMSDSAGLGSIDFLPGMTAGSGPSNRPEFEPFSVLVQCANQYLRNNPHLTVNTCESVEFKVSSKDGFRVDTVNSVYTAHGESETRYIRGLRLWTQVKSGHGNNCDQIGYCNFLPSIQGDNVERLDRLLFKINQQFERNPLPGQIVTVETQPIKWGSTGLDPDRTIWTERGNSSSRFVNLIRIFYLQGPPQPCKLGVQDFLPAVLDSGFRWGAYPQVEAFPVVMDRARQWLLSVPPNYRVINVQTVTFRWSQNDGADTQKMTYHEDKAHLNYMRYLRIPYVIENPDHQVARSTIRLNAKLIAPNMTSAPGILLGSGQFESQESTRARLDQWVKSTGARVVSAETIVMRPDGGGEGRYGFDNMHTWNQIHRVNNVSQRSDEKFVFLYRIYTDGAYEDPAGWQNSTRLEEHARQSGCRGMKKVFLLFGLGVLAMFILIGIVSLYGWITRGPEDNKDALPPTNTTQTP